MNTYMFKVSLSFGKVTYIDYYKVEATNKQEGMTKAIQLCLKCTDKNAEDITFATIEEYRLI